MKLRSAFWFPRFTLVQHLLILSLTVLLPQVVLGAMFAWRHTEERRQTLERVAIVLAKERSAALDRELEGMIGALQALATSPLIESGDLAGFRKQVTNVLRFRGSAIILRDRTGQQFLNTFLRPDEELPISTDPELMAAGEKAFQNKTPVFSNLYIGAVTRRPFLMAAVPVLRNGDVPYVLAIAISPDNLSKSILQGVPEGWIGSIVDRNMRIIARNVDQQRFVGQITGEGMRRHLAGESGSFHGAVSMDGTPVFVAYQTSALSGWSVHFLVPETILDAPLHDLWRTLLLLGVVAIAVSMLGAYLYGSMLRQSLSMIARAARCVGQENFTPAGATSVLEMDEVSSLLTQADADLKRKDEHQRTLLHELDHRVKNTLAIIQSLVTQSVRGSASPEHFREAIIGRVMALARSHEVLSAANWNEPELGNVAGAVLAREAERIHYEGDRVSLAPRVVVAFAQIFHELLANAEKHGSLSRPEGRVTVTWRLEGTNLHILWVETSSEPPEVAALKGLGTTIVRICIERQLGGTCHFEAAPEGLRFEAIVPLESELGVNGAAMDPVAAPKNEGGPPAGTAPTSAS